MTKIIPLLGAIAVFAQMSETGHAVAGMIVGVLWGLTTEYVFKTFFTPKEKHRKREYINGVTKKRL